MSTRGQWSFLGLQSCPNWSQWAGVTYWGRHQITWEATVYIFPDLTLVMMRKCQAFQAIRGEVQGQVNSVWIPTPSTVCGHGQQQHRHVHHPGWRWEIPEPRGWGMGHSCQRYSELGDGLTLQTCYVINAATWMEGVINIVEQRLPVHKVCPCLVWVRPNKFYFLGSLFICETGCLVSPVRREVDSYTASLDHLLVPNSSFILKLVVWKYCSYVNREGFCIRNGVFFQHLCHFEHIKYSKPQTWQVFSFLYIYTHTIDTFYVSWFTQTQQW